MIFNDFKTFVINLEKEKKKWLELNKELSKKNFKPYRFKAVCGKEIDYNDYKKYIYWSKYIFSFIPRGMAGCGLSHIILNKNIINKNNYYYNLVLEDDVIPLFNDKKDIIKLLEKIPKDADIVNFHINGIIPNYIKNSRKLFIKYKPNKRKFFEFVSSAVAYIITKKGSNKLKNKKFKWHIDLARYFNEELNIYMYNNYKYPKLFDTDESTSNLRSSYKLNLNYPKLNNIIVILSYKYIRIPIINIELNSFDSIFIIFIIFQLIFQLIYKNY